MTEKTFLQSTKYSIFEVIFQFVFALFFNFKSTVTAFPKNEGLFGQYDL